MEVSQIMQVGLAVMLAIVGYVVGVLKMLHMKNEKNSSDLTAHKVEVARDYVPRIEMVRLEQRIEQRFDKVEQRFDKMEVWMGRRFDVMMGRAAEDKEQ